MVPLRINGIRLSRNLLHIRHDLHTGHPPLSAHKILSEHRINMVCAGIHFPGMSRGKVSCCLDTADRDRITGLSDERVLVADSDVAMVSIYPHNGNVRIAGQMVQVLGRSGIRFHHLVSSNAMVSVVVDAADQDTLMLQLQESFELPVSHTPFCQEVDTDIRQFLKKYPETRATYVEEKIKTYGVQVVAGLNLMRIENRNGNDWARAGEQMAHLKDGMARFHFVSALCHDDGSGMLFCLTGPDAGDTAADMIFFHGPHFGDRYRILDTALACLELSEIPLILVGCTGASITLVTPSGFGETARGALACGFEAP
jgi:hypothetical protein